MTEQPEGTAPVPAPEPPIAPPPPVWPPMGAVPPPGTPPPPPVPAATYPAYASPSPYGGQPGRQTQNGLGVAALVLSILGIVGCIPFIGGVLGIVFGILGMKNADKGIANNKGMAKAGLIIGIVGLGLWVALGIVWLAVVLVLLANEPGNIGVTVVPSPSGF
jgi:hypothetical protein